MLRLPLLDAGTWRTEAFEGFVLSVGRLEGLKRTDLLIRALAHVKGTARAEIVGEGPERERLGGAGPGPRASQAASPSTAMSTTPA